MSSKLMLFLRQSLVGRAIQAEAPALGSGSPPGPGASKQPGPDESPPPEAHEAGLRLAPSQGDGIGSGTHVECGVHTDVLLWAI